MAHERIKEAAVVRGLVHFNIFESFELQLNNLLRSEHHLGRVCCKLLILLNDLFSEFFLAGESTRFVNTKSQGGLILDRNLYKHLVVLRLSRLAIELE